MGFSMWAQSFLVYTCVKSSFKVEKVTSLRKLPDKFQMSSRKVADLEKTSARLTIHFVNLDDLEFIWPDYADEILGRSGKNLEAITSPDLEQHKFSTGLNLDSKRSSSNLEKHCASSG